MMVFQYIHGSRKFSLADFFLFVANLATSLDPDQERLNVGPNLDSNCLTL